MAEPETRPFLGNGCANTTAVFYVQSVPRLYKGIIYALCWNYGAVNVAPPLKDRPFPSSKWRPHSQTHVYKRKKILVKSLDET
jgi:hypothetical protein